MSAAYEPPFARQAAMMAEPARARLLACLLAGHCASAGELARAASVTPATASGHLAKLVDSGLVVVEPRGRHRYFKLADADVAHALEALALVAERGVHERHWQSPARQKLRHARCCYGHLAGELGVRLFEGLLRGGRLRADSGRALSLTPAGRRDMLPWLAS